MPGIPQEIGFLEDSTILLAQPNNRSNQLWH
jgi:hypothetical protein